MLDSTTKEFSQFPLSEKKNTTKLDMSHTYVELKTPQRRNRDFEGKPGLFEPESTSRISQDSSTFWNSSGKFKYFCRKRFFPAAILDGLKSRKKTAVSTTNHRTTCAGMRHIVTVRLCYYTTYCFPSRLVSWSLTLFFLLPSFHLNKRIVFRSFVF